MVVKMISSFQKYMRKLRFFAINEYHVYLIGHIILKSVYMHIYTDIYEKNNIYIIFPKLTRNRGVHNHSICIHITK